MHFPFQMLLSLLRNSPHHHQSLVAADQAIARTQLFQSLGYMWSELQSKSITISTLAATLNL
jgi:hypothetical protein